MSNKFENVLIGLLAIFVIITIFIFVLITIKINEKMALAIADRCRAVLVEKTSPAFFSSGYQSSCTQDNRFILEPSVTPKKSI